MKFNDMRVATKLWATILGLLLAMLLVMFALAATIHPELVFFGTAPPDPQTF